jgi:hypothetical protein
MDKFEMIVEYLEIEKNGYRYALDNHEKRKAAGFPNKLEYIKGRLDALDAALEIVGTFK